MTKDQPLFRLWPTTEGKKVPGTVYSIREVTGFIVSGCSANCKRRSEERCPLIIGEEIGKSLIPLSPINKVYCGRTS